MAYHGTADTICSLLLLRSTAVEVTAVASSTVSGTCTGTFILTSVSTVALPYYSGVLPTAILYGHCGPPQLASQAAARGAELDLGVGRSDLLDGGGIPGSNPGAWAWQMVTLVRGNNLAPS